eukprot:Plantae.Rhodophyta-Hildenbrandia_rubra.ctg6572.p1 GENE.Plantae.Rhodophyta-Hildenbrandia_rubra.ctg6572~~Plantae.Rhodophyta-Hildenbrandia_rubra.ctg6572.p1  ORF type:complete len:527 (+),score=61.02 Plantae.Rhodophyta-Hildenbrandia_rubra.ctg6572:2370-3950(+)
MLPCFLGVASLIPHKAVACSNVAMTAARRYGLRARKPGRITATLSSSDESSSADPAIDPLSLLTLVDSSSDSEDDIEDLQQPRKRRKSQVKPLKSQTINQELLPSRDAPSTFSEQDVMKLREQLLPWYSKEHRKLPWRPVPLYDTQSGKIRKFQGVDHLAPHDPGAPYAIWVSEVMSQQTRISVVCEYYKRWMAEFPTVQDLAKAPIEKINELWAGLGYYRRGRMLHKGASEVVTKYNGDLPTDVKSLMKIPGIGRYTAGAIASIAFNKCVPLVDGNVERVFARLRPGCARIVESAKQSKKSEHYWELAAKVVGDIECAGDLNQSLMELGATVCTPKRPRCSSCPLKNQCGAYAEAKGKKVKPEEYVIRYPVKRTAQKCKVREEIVSVCVVCRKPEKGPEPQYLMLQRPKSGLLAGLWEFPSVIRDSGMELEILSKKVEEKVQSLLIDAQDKTKPIGLKFIECGEVVHIFSHIRQRLLVRRVSFTTAEVETYGENSKTRWISEEEMSTAAISTQMKKVFKMAQTKM